MVIRVPNPPVAILIKQVCLLTCAISIAMALPAIASFSALSSASGIPTLVAKSLAVPNGKIPSAGMPSPSH
ncbi:Uncharacterised protein [Shigella sonnei]|nr:Uncharacterised protein [Shigella sonnei]